VCCGKGWTSKIAGTETVQGDCGEVEQFAWGSDQDVAAALDIHPFMLSLWRKQVREGDCGQGFEARYCKPRQS
jgi:hypothetical protein